MRDSPHFLLATPSVRFSARMYGTRNAGDQLKAAFAAACNSSGLKSRWCVAIDHWWPRSHDLVHAGRFPCHPKRY